MQKEQYEHEIKQVEQTIALNTQQLKIAVDFIITEGKSENKIIRNNLEFEIHKIVSKLKKLSSSEQVKFLKKKEKELKCMLNLTNENRELVFKNTVINDGYLDFFSKKDKLNTWNLYVKKEEKNLCPSITKHIVYTKSMDNLNAIFLSCNMKIFYDFENSVEYRIKKNIQKSFSYTNHLHRGNSFLMWINTNLEDSLNKPLYDISDKAKNNKYCISKLSNVKSINTGRLSGKEIFDAIDNKPIRHTIENKSVITWVKSINKHDKKSLLFITTVFEEDLYNNLDSIFMKIFPAAIIALIVSIIIGFLLFRKFSKDMDILIDTSKQVGFGNLNLRANIKGRSQVSLLGKTLDSMLDSMQNNIKDLDNQVEERTKELKNSLEEKNTLLKEIHHRVKNNLALTINLIKLQKRKVNDPQTKELLADVQERIFTMELLHRKLYESKDLSSIYLKKYIQELVDDISSTYPVNNLHVSLEIDELYMDIEYALPCGLIINECITNSFKHAFKECDEKFIEVKVKSEKNKCILEISDNGIGLDKDMDIFKTKSLGLRLITSIVKNQLEGNIKYQNKDGASFLINFDII